MRALRAVGLLGTVLLFARPQVAGEPVVSVRVHAPDRPLAPRQPAVFYVELSISSPYHINSNRPLEDFLIPTTLEFEPRPGVRFGNPDFPPGLAKRLPFSDSPMSVYEGTIRIPVEIETRGLASAAVSVRGRLRYQACNDRACLPPVSETFDLTVPVSASAGGGSPVPAGLGGGLFVTLGLVFLGGLALNLTPCVYPMIPITISYFGGQAQAKRGSLALHSAVYVLGMALTYSALGAAAAMTGSLFGAAQQYPPVRLGIALVLTLLALSMFDVYELRMPAALNRLAGGSRSGFWGTFFMGATVGIVAAPCIGPFVLGLLTYVGNRANAPLGFALFFVLALGLGTPFLFLGFFSGSLRRLPRSGAWMVWVRKVFGFVLLAMALPFLKALFADTLAYQLALFMLLLLGGIYLAWIDPVPAAGRGFALVRNLVGIGFFAFALHAAVAGFASRQSPPVERAIDWRPYSESALLEASRQSKPAFIDFSADWCAPCRELDRRTFSDPGVADLARRFLMLKVDLTSSSDARAELLRKKYQARGVPTLVFLRPDGEEIPDLRATGFESPDVFLSRMKKALEESAAGP